MENEIEVSASEEPAQVTCRGGITLPSLAVLFGQQPKEEDNGE